jgi:hypothetical protein
VCTLRVLNDVLLLLISYRPRHEIISILVRKELIFLLIRPVLVKVDRFPDEQASRQAAVLHSTTSNFTSLAAAGEGGPSSSPLQCLVSGPY